MVIPTSIVWFMGLFLFFYLVQSTFVRLKNRKVKYGGSDTARANFGGSRTPVKETNPSIAEHFTAITEREELRRSDHHRSIDFGPDGFDYDWGQLLASSSRRD